MLTIRPFVETDSIEELTQLLHRAYKQLADMGMRFFASHQNEEQTRSRVNAGECYVGLCDDRIVATITMYRNRDKDGPDIYRRDGVGYFGQFAVDPDCQGRGFGNEMLTHVESRAHDSGIEQLALDTAESASHLIEYYARHGYRFVEHVQWPDTNYRSVVMSKSLVV